VRWYTQKLVLKINEKKLIQKRGFIVPLPTSIFSGVIGALMSGNN